jgi:hypothetical protein
VGALPFSVKIRLATLTLFTLLVLNNIYISVDCLHPLVELLNHCRTLVGALLQRQHLLGYPDPIRSRVVGDSKRRFKGRFAVDLVCKPFDATVPTLNKGWTEAAMSARLNVEMAMSRRSSFWQLEHAAWSVAMQPSNPS